MTNHQSMLRNTVREERARRGWTQPELCARAGISKPTLIAVERYQKVPTVAVMRKLGEALDIPWTELWQEQVA